MIAFLLFSLVACGSGSKLPVRTLTVDGHAVTVEVAATPESRQRGLMFRDSMGADHGMLFIYPDEQPRGFWMRNTRIPLAIAYADKTGKIVKIAEMVPFVEESTPSLYPATYALEMNKGWFAAHGVEKGDLFTGLPTDVPVD